MSEAASESESGPEPAADYEVVVIGAGQAGLAMGYYLARRGRQFIILERGDSIAPAWRERWDSLTLFTPRRYSSLPGLPFPGDPDDYPTRDEVIAYLERYAEEFDLPIELNSTCARFPARMGASSSSSTGGRSPPTRSWSRRAPSRRPTSPSWRPSSTPTSGRRTARATDGR